MADSFKIVKHLLIAPLYESELCYECSDCKNVLNVCFLKDCKIASKCFFSFDMRNCQNCILCTNGRNLNYCIENIQCTKEEFEKKKAEILSSHEKISKKLKKNIINYAQTQL